MAPVKKRKLLNNGLLAWMVGALLNGYGQLILLTSRLRVWVDPATAQLLPQRDVPVIYGLWHCHVFFMPLLRRHGGRPVSVLLSAHRDAQIVGVAAQMRGVDLVSGSSTRGGARAYLQLLQRLRHGAAVCMTPDGPRGPARQVKPGIVHLARQAGAVVVPVGLALTRRRCLRSWDRTVLPLPFGRVVFTLGPPLWPKSDSTVADAGWADQLAAALEAASAQAQRQLDRRRGG